MKDPVGLMKSNSHESLFSHNDGPVVELYSAASHNTESL